MKEKQVTLSFFLLIIFCWISACSVFSENHIEKLETPQIVISNESTGSELIQPSITRTIELQIPKTTTPTYEEIKTVNITPSPTISEEKLRTNIINLLNTNGGCELPCWWGVNPGSSTIDEAKELYSSIGAKIGEYQTTDGKDVFDLGNLSFYDIMLINRVSVFEKEGIVEWIESEGSSLRDAVDFRKYWNSYSPKNIVSKYGKPSRVWIMSYQTGAPKAGYELWLFYDPANFLLRYGGLTANQIPYNICMGFTELAQIDSINIYLQNSNSKNALENLTENYQSSKKYFKTLNEATSFTIEEFVEIILSGENDCFQIPKEIWPWV